MNLKEFFRRAVFYLSVPTCVLCKERLDVDDRALCKTCLEEYRNYRMRNCSHCSKILPECTCTNDFLSSHSVKQLVKIVRYRPSDSTLPSNALIYSLKRNNRRDVIELIAGEIAYSIKRLIEKPQECIITNVPRKRSSVARYGYDHSEKLAKEISRICGASYKRLLVSKSQGEQKKLRGHERIKNAVFDYNGSYDLKKTRVIIVDDIVTTGASIGNAAMLLRAAGAGKIVGAAYAISYKD